MNKKVLTSLFIIMMLSFNALAELKVQRGVGTIDKATGARPFYWFTPVDPGKEQLRRVKFHSRFIKYTDEINKFFTKAKDEKKLVQIEIQFHDKGPNSRSKSIGVKLLSYKIVDSVESGDAPYVKVAEPDEQVENADKKKEKKK